MNSRYNRLFHTHFIGLAFEHNHLMYRADMTQDSEHSKPSGEGGSQRQLLEYIYRYLRTYFQLKN